MPYSRPKIVSFNMINERLKQQNTGDGGLAKRDAVVRSSILGRRLREMYREVEQEPIPDEFKALLAKLESGEKN
ncbi:hypothetical protein Plav_0054 [Parvibaculum lavamentivorans DS-1]|uniref:Anti-sigma factor NepR domain-containing protein n=1 Tax=Parvibaculum lavamentivorans (strain DS-1 / DSM 13023 / NCIMB 13966) TaxID=402881 RepID=A7HP44_PARL1|nr:NepR family anti-sigma factor [Parvibaculum lavamentivorans]ABS61677.1 hypothetical protein Plav_0054 [Parvibaculum lavamentivorans DS-1]